MKKQFVAAVGATIAVGLSSVALANTNNPFESHRLNSAYANGKPVKLAMAHSHSETMSRVHDVKNKSQCSCDCKKADQRCGKKDDAKHGAKNADGKCGAGKCGAGKCGAGKCGAGQ